jgi:hypothetical protein
MILVIYLCLQLPFVYISLLPKVKMASRIVSAATVKAVKGRRLIQSRAALVLVCELNREVFRV